MLSRQYCQQLEAFKALLQRIHSPDSQFDSGALSAIAVELQQFLQQHLWNWQSEDSAGAIAHQVQAVLVEIDKQLRLLAMDAVFLQAARQPATVKQRSQQIGDRLTLLLRYCDLLLSQP